MLSKNVIRSNHFKFIRQISDTLNSQRYQTQSCSNDASISSFVSVWAPKLRRRSSSTCKRRRSSEWWWRQVSSVTFGGAVGSWTSSSQPRRIVHVRQKHGRVPQAAPTTLGNLTGSHLSLRWDAPFLRTQPDAVACTQCQLQGQKFGLIYWHQIDVLASRILYNLPRDQFIWNFFFNCNDGLLDSFKLCLSPFPRLFQILQISRRPTRLAIGPFIVETGGYIISDRKGSTGHQFIQKILLLVNSNKLNF